MEPGKLSGREILAGFSGVFFVVALFLLGVQFNLEKYENTLKILTPAFIGIFGTTFALEQLRINRRKSNMDLFDKRFSIYESVYKFVSAVHDYSFYVPTQGTGYDIYTEQAKENEKCKPIKDMIKDVDVKIDLAKVIISDEVANNLKEYRDIAVKTFEEKKKQNSRYILSPVKHTMYPFFYGIAKDNDEELKKIVDTKLRSDFEKYFTIK